MALWFGDERGYNATLSMQTDGKGCCGLVMKEDITQHGNTLVSGKAVVVW